MSKFTALSAGGVDYYQESKPSSAKDGELLAQIEQTTSKDPTNSSGITEFWSELIYSSNNGPRLVEFYNGVLYIGEDGRDGTVTALRASDQTQIWSKSTVEINSLHSSDGKIFVGQKEGSDAVIGYDAYTGEEVFRHEKHSNEVKDVYEKDGIIYSASRDGTVKSVNISDGTENWSVSFSDTSPLSLIILGGTLYMGGADNGYGDNFASIDISNGTVNYQNGISGDVTDIDAYDSRILTINASEDVKKVNPSDTGFTVEWTISIGSGSGRGVRADNNVVYAGGTSGELAVLLFADGSTISQTGIGNTISGLDVSDNTIFGAFSSETEVRAYTLTGGTQVPAVSSTKQVQLYYNGRWCDKL